MRFLINSFIKYRDSFALAMFLAGVPLVYYLRDGIGLASGNSAFAMALILGPFVISLSFKNHKVIQKPNMLLYSILTWYLLLLLAYCLLRDPMYRAFNIYTELLVFTMIAIIAIPLLFMKKEAIGPQFIWLVVGFSFLGALALIYYISNNPFYLMGQRATFGYGEDDVGNPHINSKGAFTGIVASVLALKYYKSIKLGLFFPIIVILACVVVLFLTQTMLAYLSTFVFAVFFLFFNGSYSNFIKVGRTLFTKWYFLITLLASTIFIAIQFNKNKEFIEPALAYFEIRLNQLKESFTPSDSNKGESIVVTSSGGDASAATRIEHFSKVIERLDDNIKEGNYLNVLLGNGYKYLYIDIPHLETLDSFGIVGFLLYSIIFIRLIISCFREMKNPENIGTEFLAYVALYFFIANFTAGQLLEHYRFGTFFILARFLK